jgi:hypothetical protein
MNTVVFCTGPMQNLLYKELIQEFNDYMKMEVAVLSEN